MNSRAVLCSQKIFDMEQAKTKNLIKHSLRFGIIATAVIASSCKSAKPIESPAPPTPTKETASPKRKFDFVAGSKTLWAENFKTTSTGDFPAGWNTNAGAEVVETKTGAHALMLTKDGVYIPLNATLPQNFTLEFTLSCSANYSYYSSPLQIMFAELSSKKEFTVLKQYNPHTKNALKLTVHPMNAASNAGASTIESYEKGKKQNENEIGTNEFFASGSPATVRVSMWRQGTRLRVYLNKEKTWDLPQAFLEEVKYNSLVFGLSHLVDKTGKYFLTDIRLATE
jgi:OmpA-OmpF porin, OOP family